MFPVVSTRKREDREEEERERKEQKRGTEVVLW